LFLEDFEPLFERRLVRKSLGQAAAIGHMNRETERPCPIVRRLDPQMFVASLEEPEHTVYLEEPRASELEPRILEHLGGCRAPTFQVLEPAGPHSILAVLKYLAAAV
jgi:hypothetical protein